MNPTCSVGSCVAPTIGQLVDVCLSPYVSQAITTAGFWVDKLPIFQLNASIWASNKVTSLTSNNPAGLLTGFLLEFHW